MYFLAFLAPVKRRGLWNPIEAKDQVTRVCPFFLKRGQTQLLGNLNALPTNHEMHCLIFLRKPAFCYYLADKARFSYWNIYSYATCQWPSTIMSSYHRAIIEFHSSLFILYYACYYTLTIAEYIYRSNKEFRGFLLQSSLSSCKQVAQ